MQWISFHQRRMGVVVFLVLDVDLFGKMYSEWIDVPGKTTLEM